MKPASLRLETLMDSRTPGATMHAAVDIESLALSQDAAIVAIGAVAFDPHVQPETDPRNMLEVNTYDVFYSRVSLSGQEQRRIDQATLQWWMGQSDEARISTFGEAGNPAPSLTTALQAFSGWCSRNKVEGLWASPAVFDLGTLQHAYWQKPLSLPVHYRNWYDKNTLDFLVGERPNIPFVGEKHDALADAQHLGRTISVQLSRIAVLKPTSNFLAHP